MPNQTFPDLSRLLRPRSIAVIGASDSPGNIGGIAVELLGKFGFGGEIWPVNPGKETVRGHRCYPSVGGTPRPADLVVFAVRAPQIPNLVRESARAGVRNGVVWSGGFAEVGGEGVVLQQDLVDACRETGFHLVGPNSAGFLDTHEGMIASFASYLLAHDRLIAGDISVVGQSGGLANLAQGLAQRAGFGFRYTISTGNEAVLTTADFIHALVEDERTKVIATYVEGVRDTERLMEALTAAARARKPVVMLKGGAAPAGARAALAHTGALVGADRVWRSVMREVGVIQVESVEELVDVAAYLSSVELSTLPQGNGVAIVTFAGGSGVLSADQTARAGLEAPPLDDIVRQKLRPLLPPIAATSNPIDLTPQTYQHLEYRARFPEALRVIASATGIHTVLAQFGAMASGSEFFASELAALRPDTERAVALVWPLLAPELRDQLLSEGLYVFEDTARAIMVIAKLVEHRATLDAGVPERAARGSRLPAESSASSFAGLGDGQRRLVPEHDCYAVLRAGGLACAPGELVTDPSELSAVVGRLGLPVAVKGVSESVAHRDALGLVRLGVGSLEAVRQAYDELRATASSQAVDLDGVFIQRMVPGGRELLLSASHDPVFGVVVSCGAGGTLTEFIDDVSIGLAPLDVDEAGRLLRQLGFIQYLERKDRASGRWDEVAFHRLAEFVARFSELAVTAPWTRFTFELNPVKWLPSGPVAVDALLVIDNT